MSQPTAFGLDQFDPATFTVVEPLTFEDLKVGDIFRAPSRTLTDAHATAFQAVSADNHPIHYNVEYAHSHGPHRAGRSRPTRGGSHVCSAVIGYRAPRTASRRRCRAPAAPPAGSKEPSPSPAADASGVEQKTRLRAPDVALICVAARPRRTTIFLVALVPFSDLTAQKRAIAPPTTHPADRTLGGASRNRRCPSCKGPRRS
jgi:hypothetical protein